MKDRDKKREPEIEKRSQEVGEKGNWRCTGLE